MMPKYVALIAAIFSCNIYAESDVFGGRAHFQGVLVNQGCSIDLENNEKLALTKTPFPSFSVDFAICSSSVFNNLSIALSKKNEKKLDEFYFDPNTAKVIYSSNTLDTTPWDQAKQLHPFVRYIDLSLADSFRSKNMIDIYLNHDDNPVISQHSNILISVFYP